MDLNDLTTAQRISIMIGGISLIGISYYQSKDQVSKQSPNYFFEQIFQGIDKVFENKPIQEINKHTISCEMTTNFDIYVGNNSKVNIKDYNSNFKIDQEDELTLKSGDLPKYDHLEKILKIVKTRFNNQSECIKGDYQNISVTYNPNNA
jgi:hypothetical protein